MCALCRVLDTRPVSRQDCPVVSVAARTFVSDAIGAQSSASRAAVCCVATPLFAVDSFRLRAAVWHQCPFVRVTHHSLFSQLVHSHLYRVAESMHARLHWDRCASCPPPAHVVIAFHGSAISLFGCSACSRSGLVHPVSPCAHVCVCVYCSGRVLCACAGCVACSSSVVVRFRSVVVFSDPQ